MSEHDSARPMMARCPTGEPRICTADEAKSLLDAAPPGEVTTMFGWSSPRLTWATEAASVDVDLPGIPVPVANGMARWKDLARSVVHHAERADRAEAELMTPAGLAEQVEAARRVLLDACGPTSPGEGPSEPRRDATLEQLAQQAVDRANAAAALRVGVSNG